MTNIIRQNGILDTALLEASTVFMAGVGRAITAAEVLTSSGIGTMVLADPQTVSAENVGQSGYHLSEVGMSKVAAASARLKDINASVDIYAYECRAQDIDRLDDLLNCADLVKIGTDDPISQFELADRAQAAGADAIACGTTGDNRQFFVAGALRDGPPLRDVLANMWRGVQAGYQPPEFFPSCRIHAEAVNLAAARIALGLLHYRAGSQLPISADGRAFVANPLVIGLNGVDLPSGFFMPARFVEGHGATR